MCYGSLASHVFTGLYFPNSSLLLPGYGDLLVLACGPVGLSRLFLGVHDDVPSLGIDCTGCAIVTVCCWFPPDVKAWVQGASVPSWLGVPVCLGGHRPGTALLAPFVFVRP